MIRRDGKTFQEHVQLLGGLLLTEGDHVDTGHWQAMKGVPMTQTIELEDVYLSHDIPFSLAELQQMVDPNLPWAEDHFLERVSGIPYNPPPSSAWWPYAQKNNEAHKQEEKFSHTYPERFWPRHAGLGARSLLNLNSGIRYPYGDLDDVIELLKKEPRTRQAYLPVWFPEDTGAVSGQRVPCTLGYHFLYRKGRLNMKYFIRSCDFLRHFKDDVYMTMRLGQYVASKLDVPVGHMTMFISSLHVFEGDIPRMRKAYYAHTHSSPED